MLDNSPLSVQKIEYFRQHGYVVLKQLVKQETLLQAQQIGQQCFNESTAPLELETAVGYPGAPQSIDSEGGRTIRRVLSLVNRSPFIEQLATRGPIAQALLQLFDDNGPVFLNQSHHNCLMTKAPSFSSDTHWHQDVRYWSFTSPNLISAWVALGEENACNGALQVIPGSHSEEYRSNQFDAKKFFIDDAQNNQPLVNKAQQLELEAGDVLFFDSRLLHRASRNNTEQVKFSMVFTYHDATNHPIANTRSAQLQEIPVKVED